ncbi:peptidase M15 [Streptomyces dioscori]|uniref:Peptidase M15 n=1 Tax=Streptomyces dioscori TaxID=2109333 RepID=A0A2P8Q7P2_9ACTN|nr:M15 family metallopeptidase [Streptomyces dioscori]PSM42269.1 peptidase M15 [Streptomyces dioscori]
MTRNPPPARLPTRPTRPTRRIRRFRPLLLVVGAVVLAGVVAGVAAIALALGPQLPTSWLSSRPSSESSARSSLSSADGVVPEGVTVFDDTYEAVARLDPELLDALRDAATAAAADGVEFYVNSGWRSPRYQNRLLREAVAAHGSEEEAARWVATAATSPHVSGDAVDIGHSDAAKWLSEHGVDHGLCQIYRNEPWHFELRTQAIGHRCPDLYADPTEDPRMQQ